LLEESNNSKSSSQNFETEKIPNSYFTIIGLNEQWRVFWGEYPITDVLKSKEACYKIMEEPTFETLGNWLVAIVDAYINKK